MKVNKFNSKHESKKLSKKQKRERDTKIRTIILSIVILLISIILFTYADFDSGVKVDVMKSKVGDLVQEDYVVKVYIDGLLSSTFPNKNDGYNVDSVTCTNNALGTWDNNDWGILITNATEPTVCSVYFVEGVNASSIITSSGNTLQEEIDRISGLVGD